MRVPLKRKAQHNPQQAHRLITQHLRTTQG